MIDIAFPDPAFTTRQQDGKDYIFDMLRKKWLLLTPEEWVRQQFVRFMIEVQQYPSSLIALEKVITLGELKKRFDVLVYSARHEPWLIVECKAETVPLTRETLLQALRYNISMPARYLIITNGRTTYGWEKHDHQLTALEAMPLWG